MPVTIDPRRHDAVLFDAALDSAALVGQLQEVGIGTGVVLSGPGRDALSEAVVGLGTRPGRCVVVATDAAAVTAARDAGFALVIGVDRAGDRDALRRFGADTVVADLREVTVRTG